MIEQLKQIVELASSIANNPASTLTFVIISLTIVSFFLWRALVRERRTLTANVARLQDEHKDCIRQQGDMWRFMFKAVIAAKHVHRGGQGKLYELEQEMIDYMDKHKVAP